MIVLIKKMFKYLLLKLLACFALVAALSVAQAEVDQSGFISIDCGLSAGITYTSATGINYTSDAGFIDSGNSVAVRVADIKPFQSVRSFPEGKWNCYTLRPEKGKNNDYMIRACFYYGNYDGTNQLPQFDLYIGEDLWDTIIIGNENEGIDFEIMHTPLTDYIHVCLLKTGLTTPFISALELRPVNNSIYRTPLILSQRINFGANLVLFKGDVYDRFWYTMSSYGLLANASLLTTNLRVEENDFQIPSEVMTRAIKPKNSSNFLNMSLSPLDPLGQYYFYLHFSEFETLQRGEVRISQIYLNGEPWNEEFSLPYLKTHSVSSKSIEHLQIPFELSIKSTRNSRLHPIINAMEIYRVPNFTNSGTNDSDVAAILGIKLYYKLTRNWQGDPCTPREFKWEGLVCDYSGSNNFRISSLNLSSSGLTGSIAPHIANLTSIETLNLSNNGLNGALPGFLAQLPSLKVLNLTGNNFDGRVPDELQKKSNEGLIFSIDDTSESKSNVVLPIVASILATFLLVFFLFITICTIKRRRRRKIVIGQIAFNPNLNSSILQDKNRQITYSEIVRITNNFERVLGKGGFGTVYYGFMNGIEVAVKMLNPSSSQGQKEFQAEANLLLNVHHKNLTSLVGYCNEGPNIGIIYEYMANGNLKQHLSDMSWEQRLRIAIDSAQGLEYLHHGCIPPIIHRDIKPTNILLNENFKAKLSDFGLSRAFASDSATHLSINTFAGSPGYMDPEGHSSFRLTEKSDVYSFGVVLLEIITGKPVVNVAREDVHITEWVVPFIKNGDIRTIVDDKFQGNINMHSAWKAIELAMACVSRPPTKRPAMNAVVIDLKACLAIETFNNVEIEPMSLSSPNLESEYGPQER